MPLLITYNIFTTRRDDDDFIMNLLPYILKGLFVSHIVMFVRKAICVVPLIDKSVSFHAEYLCDINVFL